MVKGPRVTTKSGIQTGFSGPNVIEAKASIARYLRIPPREVDVYHGDDARSFFTPERSPEENDILQDRSPLRERIRSKRLEIARRDDVPAYIVFADVTLDDIVLKLPTRDEEMLSIIGIGPTRRDLYGEFIKEEVKTYINQRERNEI